jgi:tRNA-dihydrouridine synthase 3
MEHWGSDQQGINTVRRFLLEWLSFLHRYVPSGLLESTQKMNQRNVLFFGRCDLETILASQNSQDWVKISELLLGPVPDNFSFAPKHKTNNFQPDSEALMNG